MRALDPTKEEALKEAFERDGFVVADNFFSKFELAEFAHAFRALPEFETLGETYDTAAQLTAFLRLAGKEQTEIVANALMGRTSRAPLYAFTNRCLIAPPHDERRTYGWHQEVFYTMPGRFVQTWAPLIHDTTVENGTIEVCVGSHKAGVVRQEWSEPQGRAAQIIVDAGEVAKYEQRAIPMKLGQMLFFDGRLFHRSGKNTSGQTRYSLVGMYHDVHAPGFRAPVPRFDWRGDSPRKAYERCTCGEFDVPIPCPVHAEWCRVA